MSNLEDLLATFTDKFKPRPDGARLPEHHNNCFGCGPGNPHGLHLVVHRESDTVVARHVFDERHEGAPGVVHGGALAAAIDDLYGFLLYLQGGPAVTRSLTVDYLAPVIIGAEYTLQAGVVNREGRRLDVTATATDTNGNPALTSHATFVMVDVKHFTNAYAASREPTP